MSAALPARATWRGRLAGVLPGLLLVVSSLIILPTFILGRPCSPDAFSHMAKAAGVSFNARGGSPLLAWSPALMRGYGPPVLAFSAPLMYWLLAAPHWLGATFDANFRALAY